jgi:antitoxin component YwqK of YwqJK toxin-antitoxin module
MLTFVEIAMNQTNMQFPQLCCDNRISMAGGTILLTAFIFIGCSGRDERVTFYPNRQVKERWHEKSVGPYRSVRDGKYETFYPDGSRLSAGEFIDGDSIGLWEEWYLNGGKKFEKTYVEPGKPKGKSIVWMPSGDTLDIQSYNDLGELDGRHVSYWSKTNEMREQGEYKNGKRHGVWNRWYRNGQLEYEREYDRGRFVGRWTDFGFDGRATSSREFLRELPAELASIWGKARVDGVPIGQSLEFQQRNRRVDTIANEVHVYGELKKNGQDWIVPFTWSSPRFAAFYRPRHETLFVWRHAPATQQQ